MSEQKIYLTVSPNPRGKGLLVVMSQGHPQRGDKNVIVLSVEVVANMKAAKAWFRRMKVEQPWETRN